MSKTISLINGPNLNLLGTREPQIYGTVTLADIVRDLKGIAKAEGVGVEDFQSNSEGALIDEIHRVSLLHSAIIINPGAYTHTSVALHDACKSSPIPIIEVHISNIYTREPFRHHSYVSPVAAGIVAGFGVNGYKLALQAALDLIKD